MSPPVWPYGTNFIFKSTKSVSPSTFVTLYYIHDHKCISPEQDPCLHALPDDGAHERDPERDVVVVRVQLPHVGLGGRGLPPEAPPAGRGRPVSGPEASGQVRFPVRVK